MTEFVTPNQLKEATGPLLDLLAEVDPEMVTVREAPEMWTVLEDVRRRVSGLQLLLARRIDESDAPRNAGCKNAAEWIARSSGTSPSSGHNQMAASRRLAGQAQVASALRRGELSVSQAEEIAAAVDVDPTAEDHLVGRAPLLSLGELREECARIRHAADPDPEATHRRIHEQRRLRCHRDAEGGWCLSGRGTIDAGAEFETALRVITDEIFHEAYANGVRESRDAHAFDALIELVRRAWDHSHTTSDPQTQSGPIPAPRARNRKPGVNPKFRAVLRGDIEALVRGSVEGEEVCEIAGLGPIPVARARELLGESILDLVITKGKEVATTVHLGRGPNAAQLVALLWQSHACTRLGCHRIASQYDHRDPFENCQETVLGNLDGLCDHDHRLKTHEGWALIAGVGRRPMVPPDDPRHPGNPTFHKRRRPRAS